VYESQCLSLHPTRAMGTRAMGTRAMGNACNGES
jgi:hypothetical protein